MLVKGPKEKIGIHLMAKAPVQGWCNTRLAESIGPEKAAKLQEALLMDVLEKIQATEIIANLWIGTPSSSPKIQTYPIRRVTYLVGKTLGGAMTRAFNASRKRGWTRALFVGTDSPVALDAHLAAALNELQEKDMVLGPTGDGGVYLIGLKQSFRDPFSNIEWGGTEVFSQLQQMGKDKGVSMSILPREDDVDTMGDLKVLFEELKKNPEIAMRTFQLLHAWKLF